MPKTLERQEVPEFSSRAEGRSTYRLHLGGAPFSGLHVTPAVFTLVWPGAVDFKRLEDELLYQMAERVSGSKTALLETQIREVGQAAFITDDGVKRYSFQDSDQYRSYKEALRHPELIGFARFDVTDAREGSIAAFSITAENPITQSTETELGLQLPRHTRLSPAILDWILDHHKGGADLRQGLDLTEMTDRFTDLTFTRSHGKY